MDDQGKRGNVGSKTSSSVLSDRKNKEESGWVTVDRKRGSEEISVVSVPVGTGGGRWRLFRVRSETNREGRLKLW